MMENVQRNTFPSVTICTAESYEIPYVLFICQSCLSRTDNLSLLYFTSPDILNDILTLPNIVHSVVTYFLASDKRQLANIFYIYLRTNAQTQKHTHTHTHTHTHVGSIKDYNSFWNKILPHVTRILVLPTIHLKLIFLNSFWHPWKTYE
jgi:hypothetical protein